MIDNENKFREIFLELSTIKVMLKYITEDKKELLENRIKELKNEILSLDNGWMFELLYGNID